MTEDLRLTCSDCGQEFTFSSEDQEFFQLRGYSTPKRCKACKAKRAARPAGGQGGGRERVETVTTCSNCGKETTVPFKPTQGRPVFCKECFQSRKFAGAGGI